MNQYTATESIAELKSAVSPEEIQEAMFRIPGLSWIARARESVILALENLQSLGSSHTIYYTGSISYLRQLDMIVRNPEAWRETPLSDVRIGTFPIETLRLGLKLRGYSEEIPCYDLPNALDQTFRAVAHKAASPRL